MQYRCILDAIQMQLRCNVIWMQFCCAICDTSFRCLRFYFCNGPDGVGRCQRSTFLLLLLLLLRRTSIGLVRISGALLSLVEIPWRHTRHQNSQLPVCLVTSPRPHATQQDCTPSTSSHIMYSRQSCLAHCTDVPMVFARFILALS